MSYSLGVDLGTTFTAAAVANGTGPTMVGLGNRALQVPSVLFFDAGGFLVGEAAERRGAVEPDRLVREFKRRLGDQVPVLVGGAPFSAELLTARLLTWVVATTTERMGDGPGTVVLTHPANWGPFKMEVFRQVATLADVPHVSWVPEPVAAAAQYASRARIEPGEKLAIYDLGGGTFDVCVVEKTADGFRMLGKPDGVEHLGGADLDYALFERVMAGVGDRISDLDPDDPDLAIGLGRLRRDCVDAKEALSSDVTAVIPVSLPGLSTTVRVTRSEFEELIRPSLEETVAATRRGLTSANVEPSDVTGIVLIGGSSRIPLVGELLQHEFGIPAAMDIHPKHDVALGAARLGRRTLADRPPVSAAPLTERSTAAETSDDGSPVHRITSNATADRAHVGTREIESDSPAGRNQPQVERPRGRHRRLIIIVSVVIAALVMSFAGVRALNSGGQVAVEGSPGPTITPTITPTVTPTMKPTSLAVRSTTSVGTTPYGVAVSPDGSRVFVTNRDDGTLSVLGASGEVESTTSVGKRPRGVAVSPDGSRVFVTDRDDGTLSVLGASGEVESTTSVGSGPYAVAVSPDGSRVYVTNNADNTLSVLDAAGGVESTTVVGKAPRGVAVSPDGSRVYVVNTDDGTVSVLDAAGGVESTTVVGKGPRGVAVSPDGSRVYVVHYDDGTVSVLDASGSVQSTTDVGARPARVAVSPDGSHVYVTNSDDGTVAVLDADGTVQSATEVGASPWGVAVSPNGSRVYVTNRDDGTVSVLAWE